MLKFVDLTLTLVQIPNHRVRFGGVTKINPKPLTVLVVVVVALIEGSVWAEDSAPSSISSSTPALVLERGVPLDTLQVLIKILHKS